VIDRAWVKFPHVADSIRVGIRDGVRERNFFLFFLSKKLYGSVVVLAPCD
jgi:hypothetical protein